VPRSEAGCAAYCGLRHRFCNTGTFRNLYGVAVTLGWSAVVTYILLKLVSLSFPVRVSMQLELEGLDISQHGEAPQQLSLSKYLFAALAVGTIMSTTCLAHVVGRSA
jgi:hypothetical protein